jgi:RNA polymerase sigma-70 factor (ECF subfamily)
MSQSSNTDRQDRFMALYVRHEPAVHSFALSLVGSVDAAEVVMQEANVAMWRKFDDFQPGTSFRNWAFQIARFEAMNFRRKRQRDRHLFDDELIGLLASDAQEHAEEMEEERRMLAHCVARLTDDDRQVLDQGYSEQTTIKDYALSIGRTPNAVRKHLGRIRRSLSRCLEQTLGSEGA